MKIKDEGSEVEGFNKACRLTNEVTTGLIDTKKVQDVVNKNNDLMKRIKNCAVGKRKKALKRKELDSSLK